MTSRPEITDDNASTTLRDILESSKTIAVVGMSDTEGKPAHSIPLILLARGWEVIPVNPHHEVIAGLRAYAALSDIDRPVDLVNVFRPSSDAPAIVREAVGIRARAVWLQRGIQSDEAREIAEQAGMQFVQDTCSGAFAQHHDISPRAPASE